MRILKVLWLLLGFLLLASCQDNEGEDELEISIPVSVSEVKPGSIREFVTTSATVEAIKHIDLMSEIEGKYRLAVNPRSGKPFAPGDAVEAGQVIVHLDNPEHENNIRIESRQLELDISQREFEKQQSLYEKGGVTLRELKTAESAFIDANYNYKNARIQLEKLTIRAPFRGVITDLPYYTPGVKVPVGQLMAQVMDYGRLHAEVKFPAKDLTRIKSGQEVLATHYLLADDTLSGEIVQVSPAIDPVSRSFKAAVRVNNPDQQLRPGMFVKFDAIVAQKDSVIVIPKSIILAKRAGNTVFVVDKGAAFEKVITTGLENSEQVEVVEGLSVDDRLVVKGYETLRDRSKVKVVK